MITHPASSTCARRRALATHRRLRPAGRLQLGGSGRPRRLDRLAVPAALRQPGGVRAASSTPTPATGRSGPPSRTRASAATCPARSSIETTFTTDDRQRPPDATRMAFAEGQRGHDLGLDAPHELLRSVEGVAGEVELELELAPRPRVRAGTPAVPARATTAARTFGGPNQHRGHAPACPVEVDGLDDARLVHRGRGRAASASRCAGRRPRAAAPEPAAPERGRRAHRRHRRGLALVGGRARHLRGAAPRARAAQLARAEGPHLPAHRRDRRRADDLAARDRRRRAQLGLPLRVDPRREPHARGALHRRLLGRGRGLRLVHDQLRRRPRGRGVAADHVRDRRRARPLRARAAAPARLARLAPRCASATAPGTRPSSTSTASCSTRSTSTASSSASCIPRSRRSWPTSPTPRRGAGRETDAGMWEMRGEPRHHLSSKVLCWTALDRAVKLAPAARRARQGRRVGGRARPDPRGGPRARLERAAPGLRAVLRLRRARRGAAADADPRLPAGRPTRACARRSRRSRAS